ncbi:MAG: hypothetical protein GX596_06570, partial [Propionibacterium sp.]|nr:hypothetical protein [Propionibacterium sp.]
FTHDHPSFLRCGAAGAYGTGAVGERLALVREVMLPEIGFLRYGDDGIYVSFSDPAAAPAVAEAVRELGWAGELAIEVRNGNDFRATFTSTADGSARSVSGDAELVDAWDATGGSDA